MIFCCRLKLIVFDLGLEKMGGKFNRMEELKLHLENCYGIQKLDEDIDYSNNNVAIIYAPNGTMKSSLAKTFEAIRDRKQAEEKISE